jgi:hypothetical protein
MSAFDFTSLRITLEGTLGGVRVSIGSPPSDRDPLAQRGHAEATCHDLDDALESLPALIREAVGLPIDLSQSL